MADNRASRATAVEDTEVVLGLLTAIERDNNVTQRSLARQTDIALGLTNAYIKRLIRKGFIKVQQVPLNRYSYYLTPKGFTEKARLTTEYLSLSLTFFRQARRECTELFEFCDRRGWRRIALAGSGDMAEIATLCHKEGAAAVAIVERGRAGEVFAGLPVVDSVEGAGAIDAVLITDLAHPQATHAAMTAILPPERVLAPALLRIVAGTADAAATDQ